MARTLFARGARGTLVQQVQQKLQQIKLPLDSADGIFGSNTETALKNYQKFNGLAVTGRVDFDLWPQLTAQSVPPLEARSLQLTAAIEGHGYTVAAGNFDGAGLTWGIVGFTVKFGLVQEVLDTIADEHPGMIRTTFVDLTKDLERLRSMPVDKQIAFADSISIPGAKHKLVDPWRIAFERLGSITEVQEIQRRVAFDHFMRPAKKTAKALGLTTELGLALCFDIHVQNGGIKPAAMEAIRQSGARTEPQLRVAIANAVADQARAEYREDVRKRKLAIATGAGIVHGMSLTLMNWGLDDVAA
jgi:hypothetical protein